MLTYPPAPSVNADDFVPVTRTINRKPLDKDVSLTAKDLGLTQIEVWGVFGELESSFGGAFDLGQGGGEVAIPIPTQEGKEIIMLTLSVFSKTSSSATADYNVEYIFDYLCDGKKMGELSVGQLSYEPRGRPPRLTITTPVMAGATHIRCWRVLPASNGHHAFVRIVGAVFA